MASGDGIAAGDSGTGVLRIRAERSGRRTVVTELYRTAPFVAGPVNYRTGDEAAEIIVQQVGPGLFPGDDLLVEIGVGAGARLTVRGQSATKLYPCPVGEQSRVRTLLRVADGAALSYLPGEVIPFRDAACRQETTVELESGARFALTEIVTAGRMAMGERYAYQWLDLRLRIGVAGRPVLLERGRLEPALRTLDVPGRHGPYPCAGSLYLVGYPPVQPNDLPCCEAEDLWWGVGGHADLAVVRTLGATVQGIRNAQAGVLERSEKV